jgi:hypothetical protein
MRYQEDFGGNIATRFVISVNYGVIFDAVWWSNPLRWASQQWFLLQRTLDYTRSCPIKHTLWLYIIVIFSSDPSDSHHLHTSVINRASMVFSWFVMPSPKEQSCPPSPLFPRDLLGAPGGLPRRRVNSHDYNLSLARCGTWDVADGEQVMGMTTSIISLELFSY